MNEQSPHTAGSAGTLGKRPSERSRFLGWAEVDRTLEVRSRLSVALDSIESGDVRLAETCLLQLLADLDVAELLTAKAA